MKAKTATFRVDFETGILEFSAYSSREAQKLAKIYGQEYYPNEKVIRPARVMASRRQRTKAKV